MRSFLDASRLLTDVGVLGRRVSLTSGLPLCPLPSSFSAESTGSKSGFEVGAGSAGKPGSSLGLPHRFYFPSPSPATHSTEEAEGSAPS